MSNCVSFKRAYSTETIAVDALIEARTRFADNSAVTVYQCDDCGEWHLTSQGDINPQLRKSLRDGTIRRNKEAMDWQRKLRK